MKLEKDIEQKLVKKVRQYGGWCLKWVCPGWAGVPDRIVLLPGGRIVFVETKRQLGGRLDERQKWWGKTLIDLGFSYWAIWDECELETFERVELRREKK